MIWDEAPHSNDPFEAVFAGTTECDFVYRSKQDDTLWRIEMNMWKNCWTRRCAKINHQLVLKLFTILFADATCYQGNN